MVCVHLVFDLFLSPHSFMFTEQLSHLPYGFFGAIVTNLNEWFALEVNGEHGSVQG